MWETLRNAWKVPELRKKLMYTFGMLVLFRLIGVVPVPGINAAAVRELSSQYDMLGLVNMMTGNAFSQMTVMAMGITPYINASIIIQLLTFAIPALERLSKEGGEEGKAKINRITRYSTIVLAALQAIGILAGLNSATTNVGTKVLDGTFNNFWGLLSIGIIMAGGTAMAMWIGERITANGIGNGISLLIFAGIISNLFNGILTAFTDVLGITAYGTTVVAFLILIAALVIITVVTLWIWANADPRAVRQAVVGRKMYGGQAPTSPQVVSVGVCPDLPIPSWPSRHGDRHVRHRSGIYKWWTANMNQTSFLYLFITALLIIAFSYFYSSISFNPQDIAKTQQQGGNIPGIRSGRNTAEFLAKTTNRLTLFAALFLAILATIPALLQVWQHVQIPFAASSMLIAVSVALETVRQIEANLVMRNYKGFL